MRSRCSSGASAEILALVEPLAQPLIKHARLHLTARESRRSGINLLEGGFVRGLHARSTRKGALYSFAGGLALTTCDSSATQSL